MKTCNKCGRELPLNSDYFWKDKSRGSGWRGNCKECGGYSFTNNLTPKPNNPFKVCRECFTEYPSTDEYFNKSNRNKDGLEGWCIKCKAKYTKEFRENNGVEISNKSRKYYLENRTRILEQQNAYYQNNKEIIQPIRRSRYNEESKKYQKAYYKNNINKFKQYNINFRKKNPNAGRMAWQKRRANERKIQSTLTIEQWEQIKQSFNNQCAYCNMDEIEHLGAWNEQLHQDHFIALSKGGEYTNNNIIPSCRSCNSSKGNKDFFEWYKQYEHYDKKREKFILEYLCYIENTQQLNIL